MLHLLSLLSKVSLVTDSSNDTLESTPSVSNAAWNSLVRKKPIKEPLHVSNGRSHELRLGVTNANEDGVNHHEDPAVREDQGSEKDTGPESEFKTGNQVHTRIVVLLDKASDSLGQWWLRTLAWSTISRSGSLAWWGAGWWWHKSWEKVGAEVGQKVESRVDGVWEESIENRLGEEPDKGEDEVLDILVGEESLWLQASSSGGASLVCLKYNDSVGYSRGDEGQSVGESCPGGRGVEFDGGKGVANSAEEEQEMSNEPSKLQGLSEREYSLL